VAQIRERTIAELEQELRALRARLAADERSLDAIRNRIQQFQARYRATVGDRFELLKRLQAALGEAGIETATEAPAPRPPLDQPRAARPPGHGEFERLYRDLARRVHPDLARDPDERHLRTRVMAELNSARETLDFERVRKLGERWDLRPDVDTLDDGVAAGERLLVAIERVQARLTAVAADLTRLRTSNLHVLMEIVEAQQRAGVDVLGETAADLDAQIAAARSRMALATMPPGGVAARATRPVAIAEPVLLLENAPRARRVVVFSAAALAAILSAGIVAASFVQSSGRPRTLITTGAVLPASSLASPSAAATATPFAYRVAQRDVITSGRTTATVRIIVEGQPFAAEKIATLADAARREIGGQQAVVVFAYRSASEIGGPFTVGRAYFSVDGRGWDGDGQTADGPDSGGIVGSVVVSIGATVETQPFRASR
jgi:hypothetical protein